VVEDTSGKARDSRYLESTEHKRRIVVVSVVYVEEDMIPARMYEREPEVAVANLGPLDVAGSHATELIERV
jgi:hypothetical protein